MIVKVCSKCGQEKDADLFARDARKPSGFASSCKDCKNAVLRAGVSPLRREKGRLRMMEFCDRNPEYQKEHNARHAENRTQYKRDPYKEAARRTFANEVRAGRITRPDACSDCGVTCKPHGHHEDYSKPLDVVWLCAKCHMFRHRKPFQFLTAALAGD